MTTQTPRRVPEVIFRDSEGIWTCFGTRSHLGRPATPHLTNTFRRMRAPDRGANVATAKRVPSISADPTSTLVACLVGTASFTRSGLSMRPSPEELKSQRGGAVGGGGRGDALAEMPLDKPRAQLAFKDSMIRGILQFTLRIAFRCVLHRCKSQDIRC